MIQHAPALLVALPLLAAMALPLAAQRSAVLGRAITLGVLALVTVLAAWALSASLDAPIHYVAGGWHAPIGIELVLDPLSGVMATLVGGVAFLVAVYSGPEVASGSRFGGGIFQALFLLLVVGLEGIILTGDLFNLFVFLEVSALSGYALLVTGGPGALLPTFRYLMIGTIAGSFYLLGVGYLYAVTGTLNMHDVGVRLAEVDAVRPVGLAVAFITVGLAIKGALFPLHGWMPDVYSAAPGRVMGFVAAVASKVSLYALLRILHFVLAGMPAASAARDLVGWTSAAAVIAGSVLALGQRDVRRMLAYSSIGQMGYIGIGIAIGTPLALAAALLHVIAHALTKGMLFLVVGGVQWRTGRVRIEQMSGLGGRFVLPMGAFVIGALSLIGLPPTAGFASKLYLLTGALEAGHVAFAVVLVVSSLLGALYLMRVLEVLYLGEPDPDVVATPLPATMLVPIAVLALLVLGLGLAGGSLVESVLSVAFRNA